MRVALLSHSERFYSTRRLLEAGRGLGFEMSRLDPITVSMALGPGGPGLDADGARLPVPDAVVPRIGVEIAPWSAALLDTWIAAGAYSAVRGDAVLRAGDKLATTLALTAAGLPTLPTRALRERAHVDATLDALGGDAWVIKRCFGSSGDGVALVRGRDSARSVLDALLIGRETVLVQPFVTLDPVRDLRVLVLGGEPVAAAWRHASRGEFRANVHRGGAATPATLTPETADLAVRAASAMALPFCGVDLMESPDGWVVLEVNASPGLEGIEAATGRDLATPYLERWVAASVR
ncbi:MAG: RimK family alpha-L-glutamate ligase [Deltaproteobacteria bacterium]|nr:MAG: RimK family alpha-L-glutamate ligase [Deltaproteobacteria bacterium]